MLKGVGKEIACFAWFNLITCVEIILMSCLGQATVKCGDVTGGHWTTLEHVKRRNNPSLNRVIILN